MELFIPIFTTIVGPLLLAYLLGRQRRNEKLEDYRRQDLVAAQVTAQADLLVESNKKVDVNAENQNKKLDAITTMVDGTLTASKRAELRATEAKLLFMKENIELKRNNGEQPTPEIEASIINIEAEIVKLTENLEDREKQVTIAEKQQSSINRSMQRYG